MASPLLVVARYNENVAWTADSPWEVDIVQKGEHLPNLGREASSYFWWMANHRISKTGMYAFVQGNPFDHGFKLTDLRPVDTFAPLGTWVVRCHPDGSPHHPGLPLNEKYRRWIGPEPPSLYEFHAGGMFIVPGKALLQRPPEWYAHMQHEMYADSNPWVMERLWGHVWTTRRH